MSDEQRMVLRTEDLVKKYRTRTVVNHVSINVKQGEIVGLLGPNGAGKTTTFYMTVGLVTPNEGKIFLNDMEITKFPVYKRARNGIGYLAQEASIFRKMTVEDNIRSVLEMTGRSVEYQKEKLESLISEFGLNKVRKNLGDQLSGGERRRAEIARCLAIDPKFIMLDEPFAGVDPIAVQDIQTIVARLKHKNIGILITDHKPRTRSCARNIWEKTSCCVRKTYSSRFNRLFTSMNSRKDKAAIRQKSKRCSAGISPVINSLSLRRLSDIPITAKALLTKWANTGIQMLLLQ